MTELIYLQQMNLLECDAEVVEISAREVSTGVVLDRTVFYPQGGGQPFDTGVITSSDAEFAVDQVRWEEGRVVHLGRFTKATFGVGAAVHCQVSEQRRALHSRLHSAGHVVDMAVDRIGLGWVPGKGYHFPDGPYVEYAGALGDDKDAIRTAIEDAANVIVKEGLKTETRFMNRDEVAVVCRFVPDYVPTDKPSRVVMYGSFGVPCGGTHVSELADIGPIIIRKLKASGSTVRVSYAVG